MMKSTHAAFFPPDASWREKMSPITWNSRMKKMTMKKITISDHRKVRNCVATSMLLPLSVVGGPARKLLRATVGQRREVPLGLPRRVHGGEGGTCVEQVDG